MDMYMVKVFAKDKKSFYAIKSAAEVEVMHNTARQVAGDYPYSVHVIASKEHIEILKKEGYGVEVGENLTVAGRERMKDVGEGDRYQEKIKKLKS